MAQWVKQPVCNEGDAGRCKFNPQVRKFPWRREWQLIPVFLPGESYGQRSLVAYNPWGREELDTTEMTKQICREGDANREVNDRVPRG